MKMVALFIGLALLYVLVDNAVAQVNDKIVVLAEAAIEVPADQIEFTIALSAFDPGDSQQAYEKHKVLESNVAKLLREQKIPDQAIRYSLMSMRLSEEDGDYDRLKRPPQTVYRTYQLVSVTLDSVGRYEEFQLRLITAGLSNFQAEFKSSKAEEAKATLIEKAIEVGKFKAATIANAINRNVGKVLRVSDTEETDPAFRWRGGVGAMVRESARASAPIGGAMRMTSIQQTITIEAQFKIVFELKD